VSIWRRQVSGVRRARRRASPVRVWGLGLPRETSSNSVAGVRGGWGVGAAGADGGEAAEAEFDGSSAGEIRHGERT
jgi:hypothetical protein